MLGLISHPLEQTTIRIRTNVGDLLVTLPGIEGMSMPFVDSRADNQLLKLKYSCPAPGAGCTLAKQAQGLAKQNVKYSEGKVAS